MRAELDIMEKIDLYLGGKMSGAERAVFEQNMAQDPSLRSLVNDQQLLIKTVNRQAIMAEINAVASAGGTVWYNNVTTWVISGLIGIGLITGLVLYNLDKEALETPEVVEMTEEPVEEIETVVPSGPSEDMEAPVIVDAEQERPIVYHTESDPVIDVPFDHEPTREPLQLGDQEPTFESVEIAQDEAGPGTPNDEPVLEKIYKNRKASFPGGTVQMKKYFDKNLKFPGTAKQKKIEGNVKVYFFVHEDGRIETTKVECVGLKNGKTGKPLGSFKTLFNQKVKRLFEKESERLFRLMPIWEPATDSNGNPVLAPMEIFIDFDMFGNSSAYDLDFNTSEEGARTDGKH